MMHSVSMVSNFILERTLPKVFDSEGIIRNAAESTQLKVHQLVVHGVLEGISVFVIKYLLRSVEARMLPPLLDRLCTKQFKEKCNDPSHLPDISQELLPKEIFLTVVFSPVIEELFFRLALQSGTKKIQTFVKDHFGTNQRGVVNALCNPTSRILANSFIFASAHWVDGGSPVQKIVSLVDRLLCPFVPLVYENYNQSLIASLSAHMTHNLCTVVCKAITHNFNKN